MNYRAFSFLPPSSLLSTPSSSLLSFPWIIHFSWTIFSFYKNKDGGIELTGSTGSTDYDIRKSTIVKIRVLSDKYKNNRGIGVGNTLDDLKEVTKVQPTQQQFDDLLFTWQVAKYVKSNAIVYAKEGRTIGVGAGQMSRVNSARIAAIKAEHAGLSPVGAVMASDAFFPFRDGIDNAAAVGIKAIIQPGGSMRDDETIAAADEHGIAMVFTGMRHFRH